MRACLVTPFKPGDRVFHPGFLRDGTIKDLIGSYFIVELDGTHEPAICPAAALQHLEPAGEPLSTAPDFFAEPGSHNHTPHGRTFGNAYGTLKVKENGDSGSIYVTVDSQGSHAGVGIENAPELALAILEAAHSTPLAPEVARAMEALEEYKHRIQAEAEDAADREALEAEAWALYVPSGGPIVTSEWEDLSDHVQARFLEVARKARELHNR